MSDTPAATPAPVPVGPFNTDEWTPAPEDTPATQDNTPAPAPGVPVSDGTPAPAAAAAPAPVVGEEEVFDADAYLNRETGLTSWDEAKAIVEEVKTLREKVKTPEPYKYANEASEKIAKAINEGKDDELYQFFDKKHKLTTAKNLDPNTVSSAAEIVKLNWRLENEDLSAEDVDHMFRKRFTTQRQPVQLVDELDEDYQERVADWKNTVKDVERDLIIEAKMVKPKLAQYESKLVLPEIPKQENTPAAQAPPTPEELAAHKADKQRYISVTDTAIKNLKEFKAQVKDEEVEIPVSYIVSDEERAATKAIVDGLYGSFDYFVERWKNPDGTMNEAKLAEDITLLENREKIFQKLTNEGAAKRMAHKIKESKNPSVNQPSSGNGRPALQTQEKDKAMADFWANS